MNIREVFKKKIIEISSPKNIKEEDRHLFLPAIDESKKIEDVKEIRFRNVFIWKHVFFSYFNFRQDIANLYYLWLPPVKYEYTHSFNIYQKVKFLIKRHFFVKTKRIHTAYWVEDNWSVGGYFHWVADVLTKVVLIKEKDENAIILFSSRVNDISFIKPSLDRIGANYIILEDDFTYKVDTFKLITPTAHTGVFNVSVINLLREKILRGNKTNTSSDLRRIYISRKKANRRFVVNENEVEKVMQKYGFECLCFEDLEWEEQIHIMKNAGILISVHGAGLTQMIAMPQKSSILEFRVQNDKHNHCYFLMASALKIDYYYQLCGTTDESQTTQNTDFLVDIVELENNVQKMIE